MIGDDEIDSCDPARRRAITELLERRDEIAGIPGGVAQFEDWGPFIEEGERLGVPFLVASAHFARYEILAEADLHALALDQYRTLLDEIGPHRELIDPADLARYLDALTAAGSRVLRDPSVPLERIAEVADLAAPIAHAARRSTSAALLLKAAIASERGDDAAARAWLDRMHAGGPSDPSGTDDLVGAHIEIPVLARLDLDAAADLLGARLAQRTGNLADDPSAIGAEVMMARLRQLQGRAADAAQRIDRVIDAVGIERAISASPRAALVAALEHRPHDALTVVDRTLAGLAFDDTDDAEILASLARSRLLAEPDGPEGHLLRAYATRLAQLLDAREGTDLHVRELLGTWFAGLPDPAPAETGATDDTGDGAEAILSSGWRRRHPQVSPEELPRSLRVRYLELVEQAQAIAGAGSAAEAAALAAQLDRRALELGETSLRFLVPLMHSFHAVMHGDPAELAPRYSTVQRRLLEHPSILIPFLEETADASYPAVLSALLATPGASWEQIEDIVQQERRVREQGQRTRSPLLLGTAILAAHRGRTEELRDVWRSLQRQLGAERDDVDRVRLDLMLLSEAAALLPEESLQLIDQIEPWADDGQRRTLEAWRCWLGARTGDPEAPERTRELLGPLQGDLSVFGAVPGWTILDAAARSGLDVLPLVDAVLEEIGPTDTSDPATIACAARLLLDRAPQDPRGPQLRETVLRIAAELDARDGTDTASRRIDGWLSASPPGADTAR